MSQRAASDEPPAASLRDVGVVVNYFTNFAGDQERQVLVATTSLSLRLLKLSPVIDTILVVDGSKHPDDDMRAACEAIGCQYYHHGRQISYVDAYNIGWQRLTEPYIALMANDIIPHPVQSLKKLREMIGIVDVGCTFPYFSSNRGGGDETQQLGFAGRGGISCEPASMTLNLNFFKRTVLEAIGGLDPNYLSGYSEPILLLRIRRLGYRVVMVGNSRVIHYDQLTKGLGQSTINSALHEQDTRRWFEEYAPYASRRGLANIDLARKPFALTWLMRVLYQLISWVPAAKVRRRLLTKLLWLEPALTRYRPDTAEASRQSPEPT